MNTDKYSGTWLLIPELCIYQSGEPPFEGTYTISVNSGGISFSIVWKDRSGKDHELHFGGLLDGIKHPSQAPGITDVSYERIDERTLDSTAFNLDKIVMYARRVASSDGALLAISQVIYVDEGVFSNFQVYRRKSS